MPNVETPPERSTDSGMTSRLMTLRLNTVNAESRTVDAVIATERAVTAFDLASGRPVREVLLMSSVQVPDQIVMLDTHRTSSVEDVRGSIRSIRIEGSELVGTLHFDDDEASLRAWKKVSNGHVTDVSTGNNYLETVVVPPHQTRRVDGREFTAGREPILVRTAWRPREGSLVAVGADHTATTREDVKINAGQQNCPQRQSKEALIMERTLRQYLQSIGLNADASDKDAWGFFDGLEGDQLTRATVLKDPATPNDPSHTTRSQTATPANDPIVPQDPGHTTRSQTTEPILPASSQVIDERTIRQQAADDELQRIERIQELGGDDVPQELVQRAIRERWTPEEASTTFLQTIRNGRTQPATAGPGIHSNGHEQDCSLAALQGAMMLRQGVELDHASYTTRQAHALGLPTWLRQDVNDDVRQVAMEQSHRYSSMSLFDVCRESNRLDGTSVDPYDQERTIRAAISGSSMTAIFSTNVNAELLGGYMDAEDTTRGWVSETDVANFLEHERAATGKFGALTPHARGGEADHLDTDDSKESSKIARFSGQFVLDEIDIINDRYGALSQLSPQDMGNSAAQLRPDLIYALLLANGSLDADSIALFHASHSNIDTNAFSAVNLEAGITKMGKQRIRNRPLNIRPKFLLVPKDLEFSADIVLKSAERRHQTSTGDGTNNPLLGRGISIVSDDRLGAQGVTDPLTGTSYTGSATRWHLAARPGENGAKTLVVKYRRGTGRAPSIRSFQLTQGKWGIGWDINHDIGVDADDYRGVYEGNN